jgi:hypothetical protein
VKKVHELTFAKPTKQDSVGEHRANERYITASFARVTNLSQGTEQALALLLDVSSAGMRIQTALRVDVNDAVRIDVPDLILLAEVVRWRSLSEGMDVGLKFVHSLSYEELRRYLHPVWAEFRVTEDRKLWNAASVLC